MQVRKKFNLIKNYCKNREGVKLMETVGLNREILAGLNTFHAGSIP